jgi:hypothetical protein
MPHDPALGGMLTAGLVIAAILYAALIRRRAATRREFGGRAAMLESYGRSGLP